MRGYPWNHTRFPLRHHRYHYTEKEYFFGGTAAHLGTGAKAPADRAKVMRKARGFRGPWNGGDTVPPQGL